ncbi:MAG: acylphosphatase [Candidatus Thermoplasmatota archaeon]|nr:acylphosphatase [Candidatus Thermoplasmatota archaeon]MCG2826085.1 acylphosphatase [Thermoplasmatales archaeon]
MLNKRIVIEGEKVHNVGYRPFLLWKVRELRIPNHDARNVKENGMQRVVVSVGGEENQLRKFVEFAKENYPEKAEVSGVREVESPEYVILIDEYQKMLDSEQHSRMVQAGLGMLDKQDQMLGKQDQTIQEVKGVSEGIKEFRLETNQNFQTMKTDYGKISQDLATAVQSINRIAESIEKLAIAIAEKK